MKKHHVLLCVLFLVISNYLNAQFVTIPDSNFRAWLNANGYASCMNGNSMDTTCPTVVNANKVYVASQNIDDLTGIQYFDNLDTLWCGNNNLVSLPGLNSGLLWLQCDDNNLTSLPDIPSSLKSLNCHYNQLTSLPVLPDSLDYLTCSYNNLTSLPDLPSTLKYLDCYRNQISSLPALSDSLTHLRCFDNNLTSLPTLPSGLVELLCGDNLLPSLPSLPGALKYFYCEENSLTNLPTLPDSLLSLVCGWNNISTLPALPNVLNFLVCDGNQLISLPSLPDSLTIFRCTNNLIAVMPTLPPNLVQLLCWNNQLTSLPALPNSLTGLNCNSNQLTSLPQYSTSLEFLDCSTNLLTTLPSNLPSTLQEFYCSNNALLTLPALPVGLLSIGCNNNQLTSIPNLPQTLKDLYIESNLIISLPSLPATIKNLSFSYNPISIIPDLPDTLTNLRFINCPISCLPEIKKLTYLYWAGSNLSCLPNYIDIYSPVPPVTSLGLCQPSGNCPTFWNISGNIYQDANSNCINDIETNLKHIPLILDSSGIILQQFLTGVDGNFSFRTGFGTYEVKVDSAMLPLTVTCPATLIHTSVLSASNTHDSLADFGLQCKVGYDLIAKSITPNANFRPGALRTVQVRAGDNAALYGIHCTPGISGSVQIVLNGPVTFSQAAPGALTPSTVNGDTITWNVTDFSISDPESDFNFISEVSTSASINDTICVDLIVNPIGGDFNPANNSYSSCFALVNSFDPNEKSMSPSGIVDTSQQWFNFTLFFQNTGNAPAEDIYLIDTLEYTLDPSTFTFLSSSHDVITQLLSSNVLRFNFPNINLIDSTTNEPGSHGYVHFKVKRKQGLPPGTNITNTAYIYFDYNPPVVTNTVSAILTLNVGVDETVSSQIVITPNPSLGIFSIHSPQKDLSKIEIYNLMGERVFQLFPDKETFELNIDITHLSQGIYFVKLGDTIVNRKIIKL